MLIIFYIINIIFYLYFSKKRKISVNVDIIVYFHFSIPLGRIYLGSSDVPL